MRYFILLIFIGLFANAGFIKAESETKGSAISAEKLSLEKSYQINQQKEQKKEYLVGEFYNAKTKRYFKSKYTLPKKNKKIITLNTLPAAEFKGPSTKKNKYVRRRKAVKAPVKEEKEMTQEDIKKLIIEGLKKRK